MLVSSKELHSNVWMNDLQSGSGSILFGGVDTNKYTGTLKTAPLPVTVYATDVSPYLVSNRISLDAIATAKGSTTTMTTSSFPINILLDTGATACSLPQQLVDNLCSAFSCTAVPGFNYLLPCTLQAPNSGNISFAFSGVNITVRLSQFVRQAGYSNNMCSFDISLMNDTLGYILGDSFVYNL